MRAYFANGMQAQGDFLVGADGIHSTIRSQLFGIAPMSRARAYWFAQKYAPECEHEKAAGRKRELLDLFHDWHDPVPAVIEATRESDILRNDVYELPHLKRWSDGRVTLLGDAAHAMTPNLGQGGCLAIEDALVLASCVSREPDVAAALKQYVARPIKRARNVARLAHFMGGAVQIENSLVAGTRNAIIKHIPASLVIKRVLWILNYET